MNHNPTTVNQPRREELRLVMGVHLADPIDGGETVAVYEPGTSLSVIRLDMIRFALAYRGVDFSVDLFSHKAIWERFLAVRYDPQWVIDPATGIILDRLGEVSAGEFLEKDSITAAREHFEKSRSKRAAAHKRASSRGSAPATKTAANH